MDNKQDINHNIALYKVGLVLSGGGLRGIAHLGVLQALNEYNIQPNIISGTSIGALVGALYASGKEPQFLLEEFKKVSLFSIRNYAINEPSLISSKKFKIKLQSQLKPTFEQLNIPLVVNSTNLLTGKHKIFTTGNLVNSVLSSFAFPGVFPPVEINGNLYIDGGVTNNFPIEPIRWECDILIGSYVNPLKAIKAREIKNSFSVLERAMQIAMHKMELPSFHNADIFIMPEQLYQYPTFALKHLDDIYQAGYHSAKTQIECFLTKNYK